MEIRYVGKITVDSLSLTKAKAIENNAEENRGLQQTLSVAWALAQPVGRSWVQMEERAYAGWREEGDHYKGDRVMTWVPVGRDLVERVSPPLSVRPVLAEAPLHHTSAS